MRINDRLAEKIQKKIERWFADRGDEFVICIGEFCQGNRASLSPLMAMVGELGSDVFADGKDVNDDLRDELEYRIFDLIGFYSSTPGGDLLLVAIRENIIRKLTAIFAETKRCWNLNYYKIRESVDMIDPRNNLIPERETLADDSDEDTAVLMPGEARRQARDIIDRLVLFAKEKFNGEKNRKIAVNWLENPEKASDICWLASTVGSSKGSTKVTLTRIKKSLAKHHHLKRIGDQLILDSVPVPVRGYGGSRHDKSP